MTLDQAARDPVLLKAGGALALFLLGGENKTARYAAAALGAWAAWDYYRRRQGQRALTVQPLPAPGQQTAVPVPQFRPFTAIPGGLHQPTQPHMGGKGGAPEADYYVWRSYYGDAQPPVGTPAWITWKGINARASGDLTMGGLAGSASDMDGIT